MSLTREKLNAGSLVNLFPLPLFLVTSSAPADSGPLPAPNQWDAKVRGHKQSKGGEGRKLCWKCATDSWSGATLSERPSVPTVLMLCMLIRSAAALAVHLRP